MFTGGTLKANAVAEEGLIHSSTPVPVAAGGGTIDCNGMDIVIGAALGYSWISADHTMGGINFIGGNGNTIELKKKIVYTDITGVAPGTTLEVGVSG